MLKLYILAPSYALVKFFISNNVSQVQLVQMESYNSYMGGCNSTEIGFI